MATSNAYITDNARSELAGMIDRKSIIRSGYYMNKNIIKAHLQQNTLNALLTGAVEIGYAEKILEQINKRDYSGLADVSSEFNISLQPLYKVLETRGVEYLKGDRMPVSCEIAVLRQMLSMRAADLKLIDVYEGKKIHENIIHNLFFLIFSPRISGGDIDKLYEILESNQLKRLRNYIWDQGLMKYLNNRYVMEKELPETQLSIVQVVEEIGIKKIFNEDQIVKRYLNLIDTGKKGILESGLKEDLHEVHFHREKVIKGLEEISGMIENYPCDFGDLRKMMREIKMDDEIAAIESEGIMILKDYIRSKSVTGSQDVAEMYGFIAPLTSSDEPSVARNMICASFVIQALKAEKGRVFLRKEALYNIIPKLSTCRAFLIQGSHILLVVKTSEKAEHYFFGQTLSSFDQEQFIVNCLANFYRVDAYQQAIKNFIYGYVHSLASDIRMNNAFKKVAIAFPLALGLAAMVGVIYFFTLGGLSMTLAVAACIFAIGVIIAAKNGYDQKITPSSHEKIPEYYSRAHGSLVLD